MFGKIMERTELDERYIRECMGENLLAHFRIVSAAQPDDVLLVDANAGMAVLEVADDASP